MSGIVKLTQASTDCQVCCGDLERRKPSSAEVKHNLVNKQQSVDISSSEKAEKKCFLLFSSEECNDRSQPTTLPGVVPWDNNLLRAKGSEDSRVKTLVYNNGIERVVNFKEESKRLVLESRLNKSCKKKILQGQTGKPHILSPKPFLSQKSKVCLDPVVNIGNKVDSVATNQFVKFSNSYQDNHFNYEDKVVKQISQEVSLGQAKPEMENPDMDSLILYPKYSKSGTRGKKNALKVPPKVAAKPKFRPPSLTTESKLENNVTGNFIKEANNQSFNITLDDPSLAPVSEIRSKFQDMKIKFKKPVPDPIFKLVQSDTNQPTDITETDGSFNSIASHLFKEILDIDNLGGLTEEMLQEESCARQPKRELTTNGITNFPYLPIETKCDNPSKQGDVKKTTGAYSTTLNHTEVLDSEKALERLKPSHTIKNLKARYEDEFETKLINSRVSTTEKKYFFKTSDTYSSASPTKHDCPSSFDQPHNPVTNVAHSVDSNVTSLALPPPPHCCDQDINYMDLPLPPDFPPPPSDLSADDVTGQSTATDVQNNLNSISSTNSTINSVKGDTALCQTSNRRLASGSDYQNSFTEVTSTSRSNASAIVADSSPSLFNVGKNVKQGAKHFAYKGKKAEKIEGKPWINTLELDQRSESTCSDSYAGKSSVKTSLQVECELKHVQNEVSELTTDVAVNYSLSSKITANDVEKSCNIEEEILYYDNMDIMEKVNQKREQDRKKLTLINFKQLPDKSKESTTLLKNNGSSFHSNQGRLQENTVLISPISNQLQQLDMKTLQEKKKLPADGGRADFGNAISDLEDEYLKLKANLEQGSSVMKSPGPPQLPPKQLKFNRQSVEQLAEKQSSPAVDTHTPDSGYYKLLQEQPNVRTMSLQFDASSSSPKQGLKNIQLNSLSMQLLTSSLNPAPPSQITSLQTTSSLIMQQHLVSPEDARARQLVDEPLAPIIEEDSTFGDSSSCASSVTGEEMSVFTDDYISQSERICLNNTTSFSNVQNENTNSSSRETTDDMPLENANVSVLQSEFSLHESESTTEDESDTSSIRWQSNPLASSKLMQNKDKCSPQNKGQTSKSYDDDVQSLHSVRSFTREISRESKGSQSSISTNSGSKNPDNLQSPRKDERTGHADQILDVEPYGMVDLTSLQPMFEEIKPTKVNNKSNYDHADSTVYGPELTPSSIMSSVNEFNETVGTLPKFSSKSYKSKLDEGERLDMPNFPLAIDVKNGAEKKHFSIQNIHKNISKSQHQRSKSDADLMSPLHDDYEEVGYDNLDNYGGHKEENSKPSKYSQSANKKLDDENKSSSISSPKKSNSKDSLSSTPGLAQQTPGSRSSFPSPVSQPHLSHHSSAVSALDRHSGNLKRAKQLAKVDSTSKPPSSRRIDQHYQRNQHHFSTLPRTRSSESDDVFETCSLQFNANSKENSADRAKTNVSSSKPIKTLQNRYLNRAHSTGEFSSNRVKFSEEEFKNSEIPLDNRNFHQTDPSKNREVHSPSTKAESELDRNSNTTLKSEYRKHAQKMIIKQDLIIKSAEHGNATQDNVNKTDYKPFPPFESHYEECLDDGIVNPYEEVPFVTENLLQHDFISVKLAPETEEQREAKSRVQEILDNIKPPESHYKPKPPVPRYPVEYDNFYLSNSENVQLQTNSEMLNDIRGLTRLRSASGATYSSSPPSSPSTKNETKAPGHFDDITHMTSTPISVKSSHAPSSLEFSDSESEFSDKKINYANKKSLKEKEAIYRKTSDPSILKYSLGNAESNTTINSGRSLGSHLRSLLGGNPESKYISPSLRRKRSLLKRSKSPGGSRRSKTPPRSKSPSRSEEEKSFDERESHKETSHSSNEKITKEHNKNSSQQQMSKGFIRRSASQRLVDRRGRKSSHDDKTSLRRSIASEPEDDSSDKTLERTTKHSNDRSRMSLRWRRSKSHDRQSPTRSKSKERKGFGKRSKSQERPDPGGFETKSIDIENGEQRSGRGFFRRSRSSSRKRERREKSSERKEDENFSSGRGRNPVKFFRKFLRNKKEPDDEENQSLREDVDTSESTEALSTIVAYKGDVASEKEVLTSINPQSSQRKSSLSTAKSPPRIPPKTTKVMKSPPSRRAKKISSARSHIEYSNESSSERVERRKENDSKATEPYENLGSNRSFLDPPQKPVRTSSRKNSCSNSFPSSDSEHHFTTEERKQELAALKSQLRLGQKKQKAIRRNLLLNRDYDSDTATSVLASDADSSNGIQSDVDTENPVLRSALKGGSLSKLKSSLTPRRPVRVICPRRSKSDPTIFVEGEKARNTPSTYYNVEDDANLKFTFNEQKETTVRKRSTKLPQHRQRNQKQPRRQTAPVDLAYASHQRQKYKTLVSLNAQTLRKVTERWLSEWRNHLPVGGFLITSWSDVTLVSHRPLCMIGNSVVYSAISTGNNKFNLACQLYDQRDVDDRMLRKLDNSASLPAHPNTCGVCSNFTCRVPRSLLDPSSGGGAADALCVVLSSRPCQSLQEHLDRTVSQEDTTQFHRQILVTVLQLLMGIKHLLSSGFNLPQISTEHLVITENRGFLQILPHLDWSESNVERVLDAYQIYDSDSSINSNLTHTQQLGLLIRRLLHNGNLLSSTGGCGHAGDRNSAASTTSKVVISNTKYSTAIKHLINYLERSPPVTAMEAVEIVQCALWGPEDLEDVGVDDVSPYVALELWIEMEQAKLVNNLAVLTSNDRLVPISFFKHQYFASVGPEMLFNGLKVLQRI